jgi:hypothetical protein
MEGKQKMRGLSLVLTAAMVGGMVPGAMFGQTAASTADQAAPTQTAKKTKTAATMPTDAEVADAKAKGMVWANENTKVYHKDDAQYGKTKHGKFMTEADAQAAGYRMAKASPSGKKKAAAPPTAASPQ